MTVRRSGFQIVEVLLAIMLVAGPLLICVNLLQSNISASKFNTTQIWAEMVLADLLELLCTRPVADIKTVANDTTGAALTGLLKTRLERVPEPAGSELKKKMGELTKLGCALVEGLGESGDLVQITLTARTPTGGLVRAIRVLKVL